MRARTPTTLLMAALLATTGCLGLFGDEDGELEAQASQTASVVLASENVTEDTSHIGLTIRDVFVHDASIPAPEGFFGLDVSAEHTDLVVDGEAEELLVANGTLPPGTYDQVVLRLGPSDVETSSSGNASDDEHQADAHEDHDHDNGHNESDEHNDTDDHNESEEEERSGSQGGTQASFDVPVNVTFAVSEDASTSVRLVLDVGASTEGGSFKPVLERVDIAEDGEVVEEIDDPEVGFREASQDAPTDTEPPAARTTVYAPNGDKAHEPAFVAEDGIFANSLSEPFHVNETVRFSGTESEAVEDGARIEAYHWDFGDNGTASGMNVNHSFQSSGVYEVRLTVEDTHGVEDEHMIRAVVANWTELAEDTSFEEDQGNWTVEDGCCGTMTTWQLDGEGFESDTAWHAGTHGVTNEAMGFEMLATTTLISPNITIEEDWVGSGFAFHTRGSTSEAGLCIDTTMTVTYEVLADGDDEEGQSEDVEVFSGTIDDWERVESFNEFGDLQGKAVKFFFEFSTSCNYGSGEGWYMDAFSVGGVPQEDFVNADLLEGGDHDGHDHEH